MQSFRHNKEQLEVRAHEAGERLRDRFSDEVEHVREGLHRRPLSGGGEWDYVDPADRNVHQRLAAATNGYVTAANVVTLAGAALTAKGMHDIYKGRYGRATALMGAGRCLDLVDGIIAKKTHTLSDKGAALDAGFDKALAVTFLGLAASTGDMPVTETAAHGLQQARILRESILIKNIGGEPNPSAEGKKGMAALWLRAGGIVLSHALRDSSHETAANAVSKASHALGVAALYFNQQAIDGYNSERVLLQATVPPTETSQ